MTSLIALAWALDPSTFSDPGGQVRPEAEELLEPDAEVPLPGSAVATGSEPQALRLSVPRASTAASLETREVSRLGVAEVWSMVMRVLHWKGDEPLVVPEAPHPRANAAGQDRK